MREAGARAEAHLPQAGPQGEAHQGPSEAALQQTLADLIFEPSAGEDFEQDPVAFGEGRGLEARDTAALLRFKDRLGIYRELARTSLEEPLLNIFPISHALLAGDWDACVSASLGINDPKGAFSLLQELANSGAIQGFH